MRHKSKKFVVSILAVVLLTMLSVFTVHAASNITISPITIGVGMVYYWWDNGNGFDLTENQGMSMQVNFNNAYTVNSGYYDVASEVHHAKKLGHTGSSVSFYAQMPRTSLYRGYVANMSDVPCGVTGGHINVN